MANINLSDDQLQGLVAGVITSQMTGDQRDKLITDAVTALLTPKSDTYGKTRASPLAECFERAVYSYAMTACKQYLEAHPEVREQIDSIICDAFKRALIEGRDELITKVANTISLAMHERGR